MNAFDGVKVFSATMVAVRDVLGEAVSSWITEHPEVSVVDLRVTQSSDNNFHCIAITVFYRGVLKQSPMTRRHG